MIHPKKYFKESYNINGLEYVIEGPISPEILKTYTFDSELTAFRRPKDQFEALIEISELEEGRIIVAQIENHIVGYVTFHFPDEFERWSEGNHPFILELGAIEVAKKHRGAKLASKLLILSVKDEQMENYITLTTEYYWHWDLKNTNLDVYEYKDIMVRLMAKAGFEVYQTNDPEITSHPANTLMARIGKNIDNDKMIIFDEIRFKNRFFF